MKKELYEYKLEILYYGIHLTDSCYNSLKKGTLKQVNHNDYITTKGLMIALEGIIYVNAKLNKKSSYIIDFNDGKYFLYHDELLICYLDIFHPPEFALMGLTLKSGKKVTDLINIHGDRIRIQPIMGCVNHCSFCDLNKYKYEENSINELDEAFMFALEHASFTHALISGGTPENTQESFDYANEVIKYFGLKYGKSYSFDVMLVPRGLRINETGEEVYLEFLKTLKSYNIVGIYANLELYNDKMRKRYIKEKDFVGKDNYFLFLKLAVEIFGIGNVKSCIIVGLEDKEDSLEAVEELCKVGCIPVLSPLVPSNKKEMHPSPKLMKEVCLRAREITFKYHLDLGPTCVSCRHNTIHYK